MTSHHTPVYATRAARPARRATRRGTILISAQFPEGLRVLLRRALLFYIHALLTEPRFKSVFVWQATRAVAKQAWGMCERLPPQEDGRYRIMLRRCALVRQFQILAHECVHLAQYVRGDLRHVLDEDGDVVPCWQGRAFPPMRHLHLANIYDETPWEQEAIEREVPLTNAFIDHGIARRWLTEER